MEEGNGIWTGSGRLLVTKCRDDPVKVIGCNDYTIMTNSLTDKLRTMLHNAFSETALSVSRGQENNYYVARNRKTAKQFLPFGIYWHFLAFSSPLFGVCSVLGFGGAA